MSFDFEKLVGDDEEFLLGFVESAGQLVAEVFEHDFVVFLHLPQVQKMVKFLLDLLEFLNIFQLQ